MLYQKLSQQSNIFNIFDVSFISKKCIGINCSTNWIGIIYESLRLCADMNDYTILY